MIFSALLAATVLMADAAPAAAPATTTVSPATVTAKAKADASNKPRVICKTESVTGSLMPKKTCYTSDDYAQRQQDERMNLQRIQNTVGLTSH